MHFIYESCLPFSIINYDVYVKQTVINKRGPDKNPARLNPISYKKPLQRYSHILLKCYTF